LEKDKGERAGALAGEDVEEERFREREEDMDKTEGRSTFNFWPPSSSFSITVDF
jgi:hypothetical protein